MNSLDELIRDIPDFPKKGIVFKDITTLLGDVKGFKLAIEKMCEPFRSMHIDAIIGIESRGFIFGSPMALILGTKFVPIRKKGKLPGKTLSKTYDLEYGSNTIEIHIDAIESGENVLIVDDLLATGGTVRAAADLVQSMGGKLVGAAFLIELLFLNGREKLSNIPVYSIIKYES
ncbi:adenine phosphoribosyltransferase [candidate division KSB1 bacterium]|nr:MAG: adenine phosphoribosyltransferase [candidate division KSB1 bacterium]